MQEKTYQSPDGGNTRGSGTEDLSAVVNLMIDRTVRNRVVECRSNIPTALSGVRRTHPAELVGLVEQRMSMPAMRASIERILQEDLASSKIRKK